MKYSKKQLREKQKMQERLSRLVQESQGTARPAARLKPVAPPEPLLPPKRSAAKARLKKGQAINAALANAPAKAPAKKKKKPAQQKKKAAAKKNKKQSAALREERGTYRDMPPVKRKKRRRSVILYAVIVLLLVGIAGISSVTIFFNISNIEVTGSSKYSDGAIINAAGVTEGQNMFRLDKSEIESALVKQLPYLKSANVKRKLPDTLVIEVTDTFAACAVKTSAGYILLDGDSKMLELAAQLPEGVAEVTGAKIGSFDAGATAEFENEAAPELIKEITAQMDKLDILAQTTSLNITKRHDISFVYAGMIECRLGTPSDLAVKMEMISRVLRENPHDIKAEIDATNANRVYYRPEYE